MTKTYQDLLAEPLTYSLSPYGRGVALGMRGARPVIERMETLLSNYDDSRNRLIYLGEEYAYVSTSIQRLRDAIRLYLHVNILHAHEVGKTETWDEESGVYTLEQDETRAASLADEEATDWIKRLLESSQSVPLKA